MMEYVYIVMGIAVVGCCMRSPALGIAALGFILPVSKRLPSLPIPLLNTQNVVVLAALLALLMRSKQGGGTGSKVRNVLPMIAFLFLVTLSYANTMLVFVPVRFAFAFDPYGITITFKNLLFCMVIYAIGSLAATTRVEIEMVMNGLMAGVVFESLFICAEVVMRGPARANGHLYEGNNAGAFLAGGFALSLSLYLLRGWKQRLGKLGLGATVATAIGLLFTMSRGNWIGGILVGGFITLMKDRRLLIVLVAGLMVYPLWLPQKAMDRIDESFMTSDRETWRFRDKEDTDEVAALAGLQESLIGGVSEATDGAEVGKARLDSSSQVRLVVWQAGLKMIKDYPFGVGYGVFPFYLHYYSDVIKFRAAHNTYLQLAAETGIPGLLSFMLFLGCIGVQAFLLYVRSDDPLMKWVGLSAMGTLLSMLIAAVFYNFFFIIEINGQQWLLLGIAAQAGRAARTIPSVTQSGDGGTQTEPVPLYRMVT